MTEDTLLIEGQTAVACEISANMWANGNSAMEGGNVRGLCKLAFHGPGEGVTQPLNRLKQRKIRIGDGIANQMCFALCVPVQNALEPA